jgi:hypothetical protein
MASVCVLAATARDDLEIESPKTKKGRQDVSGERVDVHDLGSELRDSSFKGDIAPPRARGN